MILGPALAGVLIATMTIDGDLTGIGYAFLLDATTFIIGATTLIFVKTKFANDEKKEDPIILKLKKGLRYAYEIFVLRILLIYIALVNFFVMGVFIVGLPVFAKTDLGFGVEGYGYLMSSLGIGSLIDTIMAGVLPAPPEKVRGIVLFVGSSLVGIALALTPQMTSGLNSILIIGFAGLMSGYTSIFFITWIQQFVKVNMIGRIMSIITFASLGLIPLSTAIAGFGIEIYGIEPAMATGGFLFSASALLCFLVPELRVLAKPESHVDEKLPAEQEAEEGPS